MTLRERSTVKPKPVPSTDPEAARTRVRSRFLARVPRELALLLLVVAVVGTAWALIVPPWQAPDEDVHFAYTQTLAERHELPGKGELAVSSEQRLSMDFSNTDAVVLIKGAKPDWSPLSEREWLRDSPAAPRNDGGGGNAAADYPPGYYLYEMLAYKLASSSDLISRLYVMRLFSAVWLLVTTVAAWLLAGELLGRNRLLQLVSAATIGLWPMLTFISSAINPDAMLVALWTLSTWLGVAILRRGVSAPRAIGLCLCVGIALVTKTTALALLPPAAFALAVGAWRLRRKVTVRQLKWGLAAALAFGVPVLAWVLVAHSSGHAAFGQAALVSQTGGGEAGVVGANAPPTGGIRYLASYLWQFYLPRLPFMYDQRFVFPTISHYPAYEVWLASGWASFGWVSVWFPAWVYRIFLAVVLAVSSGAGISALRGARALRALPKPARRARWALAAFLALTVSTLLAGLHWTDFHMLVDRKAPFLQGRYLLPVGALLAVVVALAIRAVPTRFRPLGAGAVLGGLVAFQIACLGLVAAHYYA
jgi:4-amino-4-deoxy-L-arabinose transferase-like glycosyltransferase